MPSGFGAFTHIILDDQGDPIALAAYVEEVRDVLLGAVWFFDQTNTETTLMDLGRFDLLRISHADPNVRAQCAFQLMYRVPA